ncbi:MAG: N-formylglutamate amidohydrolase [Thiohalobacterales bacterium]
MIELNTDGCMAAIHAGKTFHASVNEGAFTIKVEEYTHFVCTAIHNGHRLRAGLVENCAISEPERLHEEDPYTADVAATMPITMVANDSRYEYDLNRAPESCVYEEAWGQAVWNEPLSDAEKSASLEKHTAFYAVLGALYEKLESLHPLVLAYDVHSYNYRRPGMGDVPLFNIGTEQLDAQRWQSVIDQWAERLGRIRLPSIDVRAAINEVFYGRGYQATFVGKNFRDTLVLPTELKKVFMDELTGEVHSDVLVKLHAEFERAIGEHTQL